ncbi:DUF2161 family putative PD-(D/E)XK-type phosphodiesterase [Paenibacillus xylaniclasticus]|uniref:DUF2161 family putative PD-(D/E)XK-type phosphodiesterase n=1 Tax=Paenibacillus xylaniclasticus TaxID=588083 RepID=UPI000FDBF766|nr:MULTISPECIES: DUF2161 family putative PD-(D/E)XK-type phosphodiesterase [Paenibacillus]GFN31615.1 hypothetical protein PCURB6_18750 [Paenibacillus curdlanolyticus]
MAVKEEMELYEPVKRFYEARGYEVKSEVLHCDLVAVKRHKGGGAADDIAYVGSPDEDTEEIIIVEMKRTFNLALLLQGIERLRMNPLVTLVVERNRKKSGAVNQRFGEITELCRMLGLGLMTVTLFKTKPALIEQLCEPGEPPRARYRAKRHERLLKEFRERSGDYNIGGSTKRKLMTAYREKCLRMAHALRHGPASPATIARQTAVPKAGEMLRTNYYRWFERVERGIYRLTPVGHAALAEHADIIARWPKAENSGVLGTDAVESADSADAIDVVDAAGTEDAGDAGDAAGADSTTNAGKAKKPGKPKKRRRSAAANAKPLPGDK